MAAVLTPNRSHAPIARRPDLRLVETAPVSTSPVGPFEVSRSGIFLALVGLLLVVAAVVALGQGAFAGLAPEPTAATSPAPRAAVAAGRSVGADAVVVRSGDTLWAIARRLQPEGDVRPLVDRLVALNGGTVLTPGDRLLVSP